MRLIDTDKLKPDCMTKDGRFAISQSQIANAKPIQPSTDAVSRQAILDCKYAISDDEIGERKYVVDVTDIVELPPITPTRPKGKWISNAEDDLKISEYTCSNCKGLSDEDTDYCPKCGADMRGEEK